MLLFSSFCCSSGLWSRAWSLAVSWHLTLILTGGTTSIKTDTEERQIHAARGKYGGLRETPTNQYLSCATEDAENMEAIQWAGEHQHGDANNEQSVLTRVQANLLLFVCRWTIWTHILLVFMSYLSTSWCISPTESSRSVALGRERLRST